MNTKKEERISFKFIFLAIFLSSLIYFFISVSYKNISFFVTFFISLISFLTLFIIRKKGISEFYLGLVIGVSLFLSLEISFSLNIFIIFFLSIFSIFCVLSFYLKSKSPHKYPLILFLWFILVWIILAFNVSYRSAWLMENYLTVPFVLIIFFSYRKIKFSKLSYLLIFVYLFLHVIGSHYTYSEVLFGYWMQGFFNLGRNHYDRIVHFCFGFLLAYPLGEFFEKISKSKGFWNLYIPIEFVLAFSCIYEIIEWAIAAIFGGDLGIAYLGSQGDIWDAQKDMALAGLGALIAMTFSFILKTISNGKKYLREVKHSFNI